MAELKSLISWLSNGLTTTTVVTATTAVIAVVLGYTQNSGQRRQRREMALLSAYGIVEGLRSSISHIKKAHNFIENWGPKEFSTPQPSLESFRKNLNSAVILTSSDDLRALIPLQNGCAMKIAKSMGLLKILISEVESHGYAHGADSNSSPFCIIYDDANQKPFIENWILRVGEIENTMLSALAEVEREISKSTHRPFHFFKRFKNKNNPSLLR